MTSALAGLSRRQAIIGGGTLALLAQAGLAGGPACAQARTPHLRYGLTAWPPNLQPWVSVGASAGTVKMLIHGRLIAYDRDGKLVGELAESFARAEDGAWVF